MFFWQDLQWGEKNIGPWFYTLGIDSIIKSGVCVTGLCVTYIIIKILGKVTNTIIYKNINIYAYIMKFEEILKKYFAKKVIIF